MSEARRGTGYTRQQQLAIDTRSVSVALSAGAGCGKTFVLTQRYLAHFAFGQPDALPPDDLGRLVAITFTERAAREMRDRIRLACRERMLGTSGDEAAYWGELLRGLDAARISTIHAFCSGLLRTYAVEAGLDPGFEVLEQAQAETLLSAVIEDTLRQLLADRDERTLALAGQLDLNRLSDCLRLLVLDGRGESLDAWIDGTEDEQIARWDAYHRAEMLPALARQIAASHWAWEVRTTLASDCPNQAQMLARREVVLEELAALGDTHSAADLKGRLELIRKNAQVKGAATGKDWDDQSAYERFKRAADKLRKKIDSALPLVQFDPKQAREAASLGLETLRLAALVARSYAQRKERLAMLDFDDLLARAQALIADPAHDDLRRRVSNQLNLLLVDEFQDTDRLQAEVARALCGEAVAAGKLFVVGDHKQSIYRFRGADPAVFRRMRGETPDQGRLSLTVNFRSQPPILDFVNALFWDDLGEDYEPLRPNRETVCEPAVEFLWAPWDGDARLDREQVRRREADWIARRLRQMLADGEKRVGQKDRATGTWSARAARPGDIAILLRALTCVEAYEEALRRHGIDYYLVGGHAFYAQQEIFDVINLLRAIASTSDSVSLLGVLRSSMFSLSDETIYWLAQHPDGLWQGVAAPDYPATIDAEQARRARFAAETLEELRSAKDQVRVCDLLRMALDRTAYDASLVGEFLGERKLANLRKLIEQARSFERRGVFGLADFVAELSQFVVRQPKEPLASLHAEDADVVRLMTIHQAKGLEFPIVIVPDLDALHPNFSPAARFDPVLGPLVRLPREPGGEETPLGGYELWQCVEEGEELAELNRLLYVATTRAADCLILSSGVRQVGMTQGPWMQLLSRRFDLATGRCIAPLPTGERAPKVRVTVEQPDVEELNAEAARFSRLDRVLDELSGDGKGAIPLPAIGPLAVDHGARRLYSFSRLAAMLHGDDDETDRLAFDGARGSLDNGRVVGQLVHAALATIDFTPGSAPRWVALHAERLGLDDPRQVAEALALIESFLKTPRADSLVHARRRHAEVEFLLAWPPDSADSQFNLHGYLDQLYEDAEGDWHILDFKTNRVSGDNVAQVAQTYEMQMLVYALAVERILGKPPASVVLHFLRTGDEAPFAWNESSRPRVTAMVDAAIARAACSTYRSAGAVV